MARVKAKMVARGKGREKAKMEERGRKAGFLHLGLAPRRLPSALNAVAARRNPDIQINVT